MFSKEEYRIYFDGELWICQAFTYDNNNEKVLRAGQGLTPEQALRDCNK